MKPKKEEHNHVVDGDKTFHHTPNFIKQYTQKVYDSTKCKRMSHGSFDIIRCMSWAHGENWRRTHPKSLGKSHKKG